MVSVNGSSACNNTSAPVTVTNSACTPPALPVISISGSTVLQAGQSVLLTSSPAPGYLWSNGATTQYITVTSPGTYSVRNYNAGYCFTSSFPVVITGAPVPARFSGNTMSDHDKPDNIILFPNPAKDKLNLQYSNDKACVLNFSLYDISGKEILSKKYSTEEGLNTFELDVTGIPRGIYVVVLLTDDNKETMRLVLQ